MKKEEKHWEYFEDEEFKESIIKENKKESKL